MTGLFLIAARQRRRRTAELMAQWEERDRFEAEQSEIDRSEDDRPVDGPPTIN